jgi:hypothetical protein
VTLRDIRKTMSLKHEDALASWFNTKVNPGSGNQFSKQGDGRNNAHTQEFAFCWDGKATLSRSISVTREMLKKIREQSHRERPMIALRFYDNDRLTEAEDWAVIPMDDFRELLERANGGR